MNTFITIALSFGTALSLLLHYIGIKHPTVETVAKDVDAAEALANGLKK
jgi:hypothetical protein